MGTSEGQEGAPPKPDRKGTKRTGEGISRIRWSYRYSSVSKELYKYVRRSGRT